MVPRVARNREIITVVAMQYWIEAGTVLLAAIAHTGKATERTMDATMRLMRKPFLWVSTLTDSSNSADMAELVTSLLEQALIRGSESMGVRRREQRQVTKMSECMSVVSITSLSRRVYSWR